MNGVCATIKEVILIVLLFDLVSYLEDVYDKTREEYIKETEEIERTYKILNRFR